MQHSSLWPCLWQIVEQTRIAVDGKSGWTWRRVYCANSLLFSLKSWRRLCRNISFGALKLYCNAILNDMVRWIQHVIILLSHILEFEFEPPFKYGLGEGLKVFKLGVRIFIDSLMESWGWLTLSIILRVLGWFETHVGPSWRTYIIIVNLEPEVISWGLHEWGIQYFSLLAWVFMTFTRTSIRVSI